MAKNQCDGCLAGWPVRKSEFSGKPVHYNPEQGYSNLIGCTADRYGHPFPSTVPAVEERNKVE